VTINYEGWDTHKKHFDLMPAAETKRMGDEVVRHKDRYSAFLMANYLATRFGKLNADDKAAARESYNAEGPGDWLEKL
jgi:hypothetical protein